MNNLYIYPTGGLCNKLRVTFSYHQYAKKIGKKLIIIWNITSACPGFFLDYFEPVKNIKFIKRLTNRVKKIDYMGSTVHKDFNPCKIFVYDELKLLPQYIEKIEHNIKLLENNYIAVHIRRTDHISLAKQFNRFTDDAMFINFIEKNNKSNLFIATDNKDTQNIFYNKYKDKVKVFTPISNNNRKLRQTSLEVAIIDLYTCVYANIFMGSGYSSFSGIISQLRDNLK